jgi:hypothetical protein
MHAIINWRGDYRLCAAYGSMGNLEAQTFEQIYNSPKMQDIRRRLMWRTDDSCSWECRREAHDAPEGDEPEEEPALVSIKPAS